MMTVCAPSVDVVDEVRPPLDLVVVVDRSASMSGEKLELLQVSVVLISIKTFSQ